MTHTDSVCVSASGRVKKINQYIMLETLGIGSYGKVKKCRNTNNQELYAMKIIKRSKVKKTTIDDTKSGIGDVVEREMQILTEIDHVNIIKLHEIIDDHKSGKIYLIMDYLDGGSLMDIVDNSENGLDVTVVR